MGRNECGANSPGPVPATNTVDGNLVLDPDPVLKSTGTVTSLALAWPGMGTATPTATPRLRRLPSMAPLHRHSHQNTTAIVIGQVIHRHRYASTHSFVFSLVSELDVPTY